MLANMVLNSIHINKSYFNIELVKNFSIINFSLIAVE